MSYCWLNTARVLAGVVLLSTPAPFSRPPPPTCSGPPGWDLWLWRRRSGQAAVSAALCMAHCKQERKECYNFNRIHFISNSLLSHNKALIQLFSISQNNLDWCLQQFMSRPALDSLYSMEVVCGYDSLFCADSTMVKILHLKIQGS